jgi:hypothetical protein
MRAAARIALQLLERASRDHAAPIRELVDVLDLEAHRDTAMMTEVTGLPRQRPTTHQPG